MTEEPTKIRNKRVIVETREMRPQAAFKDWIPFTAASWKIEQRLSYSAGLADATLRGLCLSGEVRSVRFKYDDGKELRPGVALRQVIETPPIRPSEWRQDEVDFEMDKGLPPVRVSEMDLDHWLGRQDAARKSAVKSERKPALGKVPRIIAHLRKMFPDGVPDPANCPRKGLHYKLVQADPLLDPLDLKTLKKAIEEYNGSIGNVGK
jgi:hypothetical protein